MAEEEAIDVRHIGLLLMQHAIDVPYVSDKVLLNTIDGFDIAAHSQRN